MWAFVMVLNWSRAIYMEFVRRADVTTFKRCHVNAFEYFGGVPRRCLYDNAKVVVLGPDDGGRPEWNSRMLDLALRVGFEMRLCSPYCQGRRDIRPRGGAKVYHLSGDVQRKCPPATGVLSGSEVGGVYASGESPAERVVAASLLCLRR